MAQLDPNCSFTLVRTLDDVLDFRAWLGQRRDWLGIDTETTGLNLGKDTIRICQFGDLAHGWVLPWEGWSGVVKDLVPKYRGRMVYHNSAFDLGMLKAAGVKCPQRWNHDTMIMAHLVEPRYAIGLKPAAARYVDKRAWAGQDQIKEAYAKGGWDWRTIPIEHEAYWVYAALDTCLTAALADELWPTVEAEYLKVYEVEMGCIHVLRDARLRGMQIDLGYVESTKARLLSECAMLEQRIPVEPSKDQQIKAMLRELGARNGRGPVLEEWWPFRTENDAVSIDDDALAAFEDEFPVIAPIREWRKKHRFVTHYFTQMQEMNVNGILRCNIKHVGARTGRMSITEPALQTLPRGKIVRDAFVAREGHKLILTDFSQIESRVLASYADCKPMIEAYLRGDDLHTWTASLAYHIPQDQVQPKQRQIAKNVAYARLYGAGPPKIAATAKVPLAEIEDFIQRYDEVFPEINRFTANVVRTVVERERSGDDGWITTILGRRLPVTRGKAYTGVNYLCQSSATADVLKLKIIELDAAGVGDYILLPVHDEIITEAPDDCVEDVARIVREVMPETRLFTCPLTVEQDIVEKWGDHYPYE